MKNQKSSSILRTSDADEMQSGATRLSFVMEALRTGFLGTPNLFPYGLTKLEVEIDERRIRMLAEGPSVCERGQEMSARTPASFQPLYVIDPGDPPDLSAKVTPSPFKTLPPKQRGGSLPASVAGEYRGVYGGCTWAPQYSRFGIAVRPGPKDHDGVDLYAPKETGVIAVASGIAYYYDDDGSEFGNRITLVVKVSGEVWYFLYGHLQAFSKDERANDKKQVAKGTLLGRVGCSGNAGYNCDSVVCTIGGKQIASSHLHLSLVKEVTKRAFDLVKATHWTIAEP